MEKRPKVKLEFTTTDRAVELASWLLLATVWGLALISYGELPDRIPIHYSAVGEADGFGRKENILTFPLVATLLFTGLAALSKFPHKFNYLTDITKENATVQYSNATRLIRYLKLIIVVVFGLIVFETVRNTKGESDGLGIWFLPLTVGLIFVPLIYFCIKSFKTTQ
jgi:uncharacterized membrane protein